MFSTRGYGARKASQRTCLMFLPFVKTMQDGGYGFAASPLSTRATRFWGALKTRTSINLLLISIEWTAHNIGRLQRGASHRLPPQTRHAAHDPARTIETK